MPLLEDNSTHYYAGVCYGCGVCLHCGEGYMQDDEEISCECNFQLTPKRNSNFRHFSRTIAPTISGKALAWLEKKSKNHAWGNLPENIFLCSADNAAYHRELKKEATYAPLKKGRRPKAPKPTTSITSDDSREKSASREISVSTAPSGEPTTSITSDDSREKSASREISVSPAPSGDDLLESNKHFQFKLQVRFSKPGRNSFKAVPGVMLTVERVNDLNSFRTLLESKCQELHGKDWIMTFKYPREIEMRISDDNELANFAAEYDNPTNSAKNRLIIIATICEKNKRTIKRGHEVLVHLCCI
jgi:hypothetical protein